MENVPLNIGTQRELFVDHFLIDQLDGVNLKLHEPRPAGVAFAQDDSWERDHMCFFTTVLNDGDIYRMYYDTQHRWTSCAESPDGIHWHKPRLGLVECDGSTANSIISSNTHHMVRFFPFIDTCPGVPAEERFKANAVDGEGLPGHAVSFQPFPQAPPSGRRPQRPGAGDDEGAPAESGGVIGNRGRRPGAENDPRQPGDDERIDRGHGVRALQD